jgi:2-hydroxy-3-keto-5-methylthiopentenyl-1-phosphate phosphatase
MKTGKTKAEKPGRALVITDFDGTLCTVDMGNRILNHFTRDGWQGIDDAYLRGDIGSKSAYTQIAPFLKGTPEEMADYARRHGGIDPYFGEFLRFAGDCGIDIQIVSDGLDLYIEAILAESGYDDIPFISNSLLYGDDVFSLAFPAFDGFCGRCGTCKRSVVEDRRKNYDTIIYIGDGHSDVCPSGYADLVFAKGFLLGKCREKGTACVPFENFGDVLARLKKECPR